MKDRQFHIYLDDEEYGQVLQALIDLKNNLIRGFAYMPRRLMNCAIRKNRLKRIRAMALKPKPDIRRSTRSMSFGRS